MGTGSNLLERVKNLGSQALFVGDCRCLSIDADKFASVEGNCIYYVVEEPWYDVWRAPSHEAAPVMAAGCLGEAGDRNTSCTIDFTPEQF